MPTAPDPRGMSGITRKAPSILERLWMPWAIRSKNSIPMWFFCRKWTFARSDRIFKINSIIWLEGADFFTGAESLPGTVSMSPTRGSALPANSARSSRGEESYQKPRSVPCKTICSPSLARTPEFTTTFTCNGFYKWWKSADFASATCISKLFPGTTAICTWCACRTASPNTIWTLPGGILMEAHFFGTKSKNRFRPTRRQKRPFPVMPRCSRWINSF